MKTAAVVATPDGRVVAELPGLAGAAGRLRKVRHLQRPFARTQQGLGEPAQGRGPAGPGARRVAAVRADALHTFTARLAREHGVVVVEDLATTNLIANRHLAAAIGDQGWAELARQLEYKAARHGGQMSSRTAGSRARRRARRAAR